MSRPYVVKVGDRFVAETGHTSDQNSAKRFTLFEAGDEIANVPEASIEVVEHFAPRLQKRLPDTLWSLDGITHRTIGIVK